MEGRKEVSLWIEVFVVLRNKYESREMAIVIHSLLASSISHNSLKQQQVPKASPSCSYCGHTGLSYVCWSRALSFGELP